jgi:hypothetical protein
VTDGPPKPRTPARVVAIGCTVLVAVAAVISGVVGYTLYKISKNLDDLAEVGRTWLVRRAEIQSEVGEIQKIEPLRDRRDIDLKRDSGWFEYTVTGSKAAGRARVSLSKFEGEWRAVGARLSVDGREVTIGTPP